jgi:D-lyxose ketol-isomerase
MTSPQTQEASAIRRVREQTLGLIQRSGFPVTEADLANLKLNDFGLGRLTVEGFEFIDFLLTPRLRMTLLVLLPNQTLPEHYHPAYGQEPGKEETLRCLWGQTRLYVPGESNNPRIFIPEGKAALYQSRHEVRLNRGEQYTFMPPVPHWMQGGPEGCVNLAMQNRVDEMLNVFTDTRSTGCPIPLTG